MHDSGRNRDIPIKVYYPEHLSNSVPLIIFSPGYGGNREGYAYLGRGWAAAGYIVILPRTRAATTLPFGRTGDKYQVTVNGANHLAFAMGRRFHDCILQESTAFWDAHLKGKSKSIQPMDACEVMSK